uniref:Uncharacterized protein n=1 Tax=Monopterus albus TaxID=43700 RepID=A0A3Q3ICG8_MONAL
MALPLTKLHQTPSHTVNLLVKCVKAVMGIVAKYSLHCTPKSLLVLINTIHMKNETCIESPGRSSE